MGLFEVLRHLPRLRQVLNDTRRRLRENPPDVLVGIDAPDFNLRIEKFARRLGIRTVHYVSPSVWAWRQGRVGTIRAACNRVLCLLPFEASFLEQNGIAASFVGHPLADEIPAGLDRDEARRALQIKGPRVIGMLPGSRSGEVSRLGPVFAQTAAWLEQQDGDMEFVAPAATAATGKLFQEAMATHAPKAKIRIIDGHAREVIAASDVVLLASGTATLETMLVNRPMVVAYRIAPLTYWLVITFKLIKAKFAALPNLLAGRELVPEYLQHAAQPEVLGAAVQTWLQDEAARQRLTAEFEAMRDLLKQGASVRAAEAVLAEAALSADAGASI